MQIRIHNEHGIALVIALLVVALASMAAVTLASRQAIDIRRTSNIISHDQAYLVALGTEIWARQILVRDRRKNKTDSLNDIWASDLDVRGISDAVITGRIEDLQARFNLNNLVDTSGARSDADVKRFERLLQALELDSQLSQALVDWLDYDLDATPPAGAEDGVYLDQDIPYRASNSLMASPSELRLINGYTKDIVDRLEPYITTLPERTDININTASVPVLMAAVDGLTANEAEQIIEARGGNGFADITAFRGLQAMEGREVAGIGVSSQFFLASFSVQMNRGRARLYSILQRNDDEEGKVRVVLRGQGSY